MNKIFRQSMEIGAIFYKQYFDNEITDDWCGSEECATMTKKAIEYAKENNITLECALYVVMEKLLKDDFDTIEEHAWDDYCRGFLAGEVFGMPTKNNLSKVRKAEKLWKNSHCGYYQEILHEVFEESK